MKRCLLISYYFAPRVGIGSQRPTKLAKYLPHYGWEPVILTPKLPGQPLDSMRIIETDYKDALSSFKAFWGFNQRESVQNTLNIHTGKNGNSPALKYRIIKFAKEIIAYPDQQRGWYKFAVQSGREFLDRERVDVMLSTSYPVTSHIIASELKKKYRIPWVADLRDLWTQNHFNKKFNIIRRFEQRLELETLAQADALVTVTPRFADKLKILHRNKYIICITNGYDSDDFLEAAQRWTKKFTITYTGTFYNGKRDPSLLFDAISSLLKENRIDRNRLEIRFCGPHDDWLVGAVSKYDLNDVVTLYGNVSREEALEKQKESQILLLLLDSNNNEEDVYPAKIFEYFGARRPIIAVGGSGGAAKELLDETNAGEFAVDKSALKAVLYRYYQQFVTFGTVSCNSNNKVENYIYKSIAGKYSEILNSVMIK